MKLIINIIGLALFLLFTSNISQSQEYGLFDVTNNGTILPNDDITQVISSINLIKTLEPIYHKLIT